MTLEDIRCLMARSLPPETFYAGDHLLNPDVFDASALETSKPAAVLIGLITRDDTLHVLLTQRADGLRNHSGQVAFPGGRLDAGETPHQAALRETFEEVGIAPEFIKLLGDLPPYLSGTGYLIHPVVAALDNGISLKLNAAEVQEAFEVPLTFLLDASNHQTQSRVWNGKTRYFYAMPYHQRYIWGVTAGIIRALYERLKP